MERYTTAWKVRHMQQTPDLIAKIYLFPTSEGGRQGPTPSEKFGCLLEFNGEFFDCRLLLEETGALWPGQEAVISIKFLNPDLAKHQLKLGDSFYLYEGKRIAEGEVEKLF
jgi:hypothetical protein